MLKKLAEKVKQKAVEEYGEDSLGVLSGYISESIKEIIDKDFGIKKDITALSGRTVTRFLDKYLNNKEKPKSFSDSTKNQLARFIGYEDYHEFVQWEKEEKSIKDKIATSSGVTINNYGKDTKIYPDMKVDGDLTINIS